MVRYSNVKKKKKKKNTKKTKKKANPVRRKRSWARTCYRRYDRDSRDPRKKLTPISEVDKKGGTCGDDARAIYVISILR